MQTKMATKNLPPDDGPHDSDATCGVECIFLRGKLNTTCWTKILWPMLHWFLEQILMAGAQHGHAPHNNLAIVAMGS